MSGTWRAPTSLGAAPVRTVHARPRPFRAREPRTIGLGHASTLLALQRAAGNTAVVRHLQREGDAGAPTDGGIAAPGPGDGTTAPKAVPATAPPRKNYVFLMGDSKRDSFYAAANVYFAHNESGAEVVRDKRTLAEVIAHVNAGATPALKIIIVSHANEEGNLGFSLDAADLKRDAEVGDGKPRTEFKELRDANAAGGLPAADVAKIDASTRVDIRGCNIGRSQLMLDALDRAFGGATQVTAPTHKQEYSFSSAGGGKQLTTEEALFQYSIEDPGHPTISPAERATRFMAKYPDVPAAQWPTLLSAAKEQHTKRTATSWTGPLPPADDAGAVFARMGTAKVFPAVAGWVVTYKGRTDVGGRWRFEVQADRVTPKGSETRTKYIDTDIPPDAETLKARQVADSGRPGAYLWTVEDQVKGATLTRTVFSERTEWVIDKRIVGKTGTAHPPTSDPTYYGQSTYAPPAPSLPTP